MSKKIVFRVHQGPTGWLVEDGTPIGPFHTKQQAIDLAAGMVAIIQKAGQEAAYIVEDPAESAR